jgi:hypothetical protein
VKAEDIPAGARLFSDWNQLVAASDVDVTVETMGGTDEARQLVLASLKQKTRGHCQQESFGHTG